MEQIFRNQKLNVSVRTVRWENDVLFYAKDIAESLGYADPKKAVQKLVRKQNKIRLEGLTKGNETFPLLKGHPGTALLYEPGLYQLIFNSRCKL